GHGRYGDAGGPRPGRPRWPRHRRRGPRPWTFDPIFPPDARRRGRPRPGTPAQSRPCLARALARPGGQPASCPTGSPTREDHSLMETTAATTTPPTYGLFVNGEWTAAATGRTFPVTDPATGETLAH